MSSWKPGQSGNPSGSNRAKRPFDKALWTELCTDGLHDDGSPKKLRRIAQKLIKCALDGESWAGLAVMERMDGKVPQAVSVGLDEDQAEGIAALLEAINGRTRGLPGGS